MADSVQDRVDVECQIKFSVSSQVKICPSPAVRSIEMEEANRGNPTSHSCSWQSALPGCNVKPPAPWG